MTASIKTSFFFFSVGIIFNCEMIYLSVWVFSLTLELLRLCRFPLLHIWRCYNICFLKWPVLFTPPPPHWKSVPRRSPVPPSGKNWSPTHIDRDVSQLSPTPPTPLIAPQPSPRLQRRKKNKESCLKKTADKECMEKYLSPLKHIANDLFNKDSCPTCEQACKVFTDFATCFEIMTSRNTDFISREGGR